jgi:hypothetical protein
MTLVWRWVVFFQYVKRKIASVVYYYGQGRSCGVSKVRSHRALKTREPPNH